MVLKMPEEVWELLQQLNSNGYSSYVVGRGIADLLTHNEPKRWEVVTSASLDEITNLFWQTFATASKEGYLTVIVWQKPIEVTSLGLKSIKDFLLQQDFSIESLAYNWREKVIIDFSDAKRDLAQRKIELLGNPEDIFKRSPLTMLKAIRLAAQYQFSLDDSYLESIKRNSGLLSTISLDKVRDEIALIILSDKPSLYIGILRETGILRLFLPELEEAFDFQLDEGQALGWHLAKTLDYLPKNLEFRLAGLFHDLGKLTCKRINHKGETIFPGHEESSAIITKSILDRLNFFMKVVGYRINHHLIINLVDSHMFSYNPSTTTDKGVERLISRIGIENIQGLLALRKANILAGSQAKQSNISYYHSLENRLKRILKDI